MSLGWVRQEEESSEVSGPLKSIEMGSYCLVLETSLGGRAWEVVLSLEVVRIVVKAQDGWKGDCPGRDMLQGLHSREAGWFHEALEQSFARDALGQLKALPTSKDHDLKSVHVCCRKLGKYRKAHPQKKTYLITAFPW